MNKFIKRSIQIIGVIGLSGVAAFAGGGYTGAPAPSVITATLVPGVPNIVLTNNVNVQQVQLLSASGSGTVSFYDCQSTNPPFLGYQYTNDQYVSYAGYPTNYTTTFVGYNGITNYYTNTGWWTFSVTNAPSTNSLPPKGVFFTTAGVISSSSSLMSFQRGVSLIATTNATAVIYYTPNR
jgi:hypothetical protein